MREEELQYILDSVNYWLKFAEAKNGTLVALVGASLIGVIRILSLSTFSGVIEVYSYNYLLFASFSLLFSLISFIPQIETPAYLKSEDTNKNDNLYFYGHLKKHDSNSLLHHLFPDQEGFGRRQENLAEQIIINSGIAYNKYQFFKIAILLLIFGLITPILFIPAIIYYKGFFKKLFN